MEKIAELKQRIKRLEAALKPFAREAGQWSVTVPDGYKPGVSEQGSKQVYCKAEFSIGHCRKAAELLGQKI